jgi:hypothetical protein
MRRPTSEVYPSRVLQAATGSGVPIRWMSKPSRKCGQPRVLPQGHDR